MVYREDPNPKYVFSNEITPDFMICTHKTSHMNKQYFHHTLEPGRGPLQKGGDGWRENYSTNRREGRGEHSSHGIMVRARLGRLRSPARGPDEWARANHAGL